MSFPCHECIPGQYILLIQKSSVKPNFVHLTFKLVGWTGSGQEGGPGVLDVKWECLPMAPPTNSLPPTPPIPRFRCLSCTAWQDTQSQVGSLAVGNRLVMSGAMQKNPPGATPAALFTLLPLTRSSCSSPNDARRSGRPADGGPAVLRFCLLHLQSVI